MRNHGTYRERVLPNRKPILTLNRISRLEGEKLPEWRREVQLHLEKVEDTLRQRLVDIDKTLRE